MNALDSDAELPKNHVKRIVKSKLAELLGEESSDTRKQLALNKDALLAFSESARVFVWYVTSTANDICRQSKRQTVGAEDVLRALDDLEFGEFVPQLKDALEEFKKDNKEKNRRKQEQLKKRKVERTTQEEAAGQVEKPGEDGEREDAKKAKIEPGPCSDEVGDGELGEGRDAVQEGEEQDGENMGEAVVREVMDAGEI